MVVQKVDALPHEEAGGTLLAPRGESLHALLREDCDNTVRWLAGERLDQLYEQRCDLLIAAGRPEHLAVFTKEAALTFDELDQSANRLARHLLARGVRPGDRVGLLLDRSHRAYVALLAVLKVHAAYVPLDAGFPEDRIAYIVGDAGVRSIVTLSTFRPLLEKLDASLVCLDEDEAEIAAQMPSRLHETERGVPADDLCYIVYTSGSTGKPKGVAIEHASICNFVKVAGETYGIRDDDRVYQGMTIAFDFSVEELWVPLIAGATLVPAGAGGSLVGRDLATFLTDHEVTAMCCVPTLLATIEEDLPGLRFLLVSGESCPQDLVRRWHRDGRTLLNAYGPTEATVTATLTELHPLRPVTIGRPLPTYSVVILHESRSEVLPFGAQGEIGIAGIGLARGYVNRDDLTSKAFIDDFIGLPNNPSRKIYRTGDLGRINEDGEIEFLGRIDTQVKIRGYRIELTEIESVILEFPEIAQAVVHAYEAEPGATPELVAYYTLRTGVAELSTGALAETLKSRLPAYMIPAYVEELPLIPMLPSGKADRKQLPPPKGPRFVARTDEVVAPRNELEELVAGALAEVLKLDHVSVIDHFFDELGAHSLLMAQLCTRIREQMPGANVSMRDVYAHPTVERLATHLATQRVETEPPVNEEPYHVPSALEYYTCGALQALFFAAYAYFYLWLAETGVLWIRSAEGGADLFLRTVGFSAWFVFAPIVLAVAVKWIVVGKWKAERIPIWSLRYFRFWVVRELVQLNPALFFRGAPLFNWYLRALGAKIGRNAVIKVHTVPVCTDLISIGEHSVLRKESILQGYAARGGYIHTGPVTIGKNAYVGVGSVVDIDTRMEDGSQLGHASTLWPGQVVPAGKRYHGTPAQESTASYNTLGRGPVYPFRKTIYTVVQVALICGLLGPVSVLAIGAVFSIHLTDTFPTTSPRDVFLVSLGLFAILLLLQLVSVLVLPRLFGLLLKPDRVYKLYGFRYLLFKAVQITSNSHFLNGLFGDSSAIVHYLRAIGFDLGKIVQMGSNFGMAQRHDSPFLCKVGSGTMVSDGISIINLELSSTSFRLRRARIGEHNYFGNNVHYPVGGRTGENCLLATKVMIPVDGPVHENVGLLGSPPFEIPRTVLRDRDLGTDDEELRRKRLPRKNRHNLLTATFFLALAWAYLYATLAFFVEASEQHPEEGLSIWFLAIVAWMFATSLLSLIVENLARRQARLRPMFVSIYDEDFWRIERYWKLTDMHLGKMFRGTPFKNMVSRMQGARVGKRVFDDGVHMTERGLVEIGDFACFNDFSTLQSHSLEEGVFKSDRVRVGKGCTLGVNAFVHYGVELGENVVLAANSFLMKGEAPDPDSTWGGNPARPRALRTPPTARSRRSSPPRSPSRCR